MHDFMISEYQSKLKTAEEAVKVVQSGDRVYIGTATSTAYVLAEALAKRGDELEDITILCSNIPRECSLFDGSIKGIRYSSYFLGNMERKALSLGLLDYTSFHLSQIDIWAHHIAKPDVVFLEVSTPDINGNMSFGATGTCVNSYLLDVAKTVVLQVNSNVPHVFGEYNKIHFSQADIIVEADDELVTVGDSPITPEIRKISNYLIDQVNDGDCIQLGIGGAANAVGYGLKNKNDLGAHTELMGDALMYLMKRGVITNSRKVIFPNKTIASFAMGSKELYEFLNYNEDMYFMPMPMVNSARSIGRNKNMISINTALTIDLTGQVVADNINGRPYSGVGGQIDFVRGAQISEGGKSFIAVTSTFNNKKTGLGTRIVAQLPQGACVTTPRSDVQYIVTEYGCVNLKQLTMRDRARALIELAHPDFRGQLTDEAKAAGLL